MKSDEGGGLTRRSFMLGTLAMSTFAAWALPPKPDFSGMWRQSNDRCMPKRSGEVTRRIEQHANEFLVETTIAKASGAARHAVQIYSLDGKSSVSKGADGDVFHTAVVWKGASLVFSVEEHEDGQILESVETWTLLDDGATLQVERERLSPSRGAARQTLVYVRQ